MASPTQYSLTLEELTELLIQKQEITEGRWMLGFDFNFMAGMVGNTPSASVPTAMFQILNVTLTRADDAPQDVPLVIDAGQKKEPTPPSAKRRGRSKTTA